MQDILDRAGIGRTTFYAHYFDKEDVLNSMTEQQLEMFTHQIAHSTARQRVVPSLELFEHIYQSPHQHFRALMRGHASEPCGKLCRRHSAEQLNQPSAPCVQKDVLRRSLCQWSPSTWPVPFSPCSNGGSLLICPTHQNKWRTFSSNWRCPACGQCSRKSEQKSASVPELFLRGLADQQALSPHPQGIFTRILGRDAQAL